MEKRYYILEYSNSAHCCFKATVMDRTRKEGICECFELNDARDICDTFNTVEEGGWL